MGAAIRDARRQRGWTQQELASAAGVSRHWLGAIERGTRSGADLTLILRTLATLDVVLLLDASSTDEHQPAPPGLRSAGPAADLDDIVDAHTHRR